MRTLAALVFPGFQTLDFFGPLEILGGLRGEVDIKIVAETLDPVPSVHGPRTSVDRVFSDACDYDLLLIPGGDAALVDNEEIKKWIIKSANHAELVMAVCTGSVLLATTGLLDGRRATTNKQDFLATVTHAPNVEWVKQARWVEDGKFFTSSGVSAGIDMSLAAMARLFGDEVAATVRRLRMDAVSYEYLPTWELDAAQLVSFADTSCL